ELRAVQAGAEFQRLADQRVESPQRCCRLLVAGEGDSVVSAEQRLQFRIHSGKVRPIISSASASDIGSWTDCQHSSNNRIITSMRGLRSCPGDSGSATTESKTRLMRN